MILSSCFNKPEPKMVEMARNRPMDAVATLQACGWTNEGIIAAFKQHDLPNPFMGSSSSGYSRSRSSSSIRKEERGGKSKKRKCKKRKTKKRKCRK